MEYEKWTAIFPPPRPYILPILCAAIDRALPIESSVEHRNGGWRFSLLAKARSPKELQLQSGADRLLLPLLPLKPGRPYRDAGIAGRFWSGVVVVAAANRNQFVRLIRGVTNKVTYRGVCRTSRAIYFRAARMRREQRKLVVHDVLPPRNPPLR